MSDRPNLFLILYALLAHRISRQMFCNVRQSMSYLITNLPLYDFGGLTFTGLFLLAIVVIVPSFWPAIHLDYCILSAQVPCNLFGVPGWAERIHWKGYPGTEWQWSMDDLSFMPFGSSSCNIFPQAGWKLNPAHVQLLEGCYCTWLQCAL